MTAIAAHPPIDVPLDALLPPQPADGIAPPLRQTGTSRVLPGPALAVGRPPRIEAAVLTTVVPLLAVPVLLATMAALWAMTVAVALTAAVVWLSLARRIVVGQDWVADRRMLRYRITYAAHLRAAELVDTGHGGVLRLHRHAGRPHRLRRIELEAPATRRALAELLAASPAADRHVALALASGTAA